MMRLFRAEIAFLNGIDCYSWPCSRCFNSSCCCFAFSIIHFWVRHQRICIPSLALLFLINFLSVCLFHSHRFIDFSPFFFLREARGIWLHSVDYRLLHPKLHFFNVFEQKKIMMIILIISKDVEIYRLIGSGFRSDHDILIYCYADIPMAFFWLLISLLQLQKNFIKS